jgi:RNA polymerase sigma factor (sigma-70 family)
MQAAQAMTLDRDSALGRIFEEHHSLVYRAAYRVTGSASDAEDVLQTVFVRLVRQGQAERLENPGGYLRRAAVNAALDVLRRRPALVSLEAARLSDPALESDARPTPPALFELGELRRALRAALLRLHPRAAEMCALRFLEGHDNREIARLMGTSAAVVAVTLHRARARLRRDLGGFMAAHR